MFRNRPPTVAESLSRFGNLCGMSEVISLIDEHFFAESYCIVDSRNGQYGKAPRRKNLPWTADEEEVLGAGYERFKESKHVWADIRDFCQGFHPQRTALNLKDK
jgi:hypothetical protein